MCERSYDCACLRPLGQEEPTRTTRNKQTLIPVNGELMTPQEARAIQTGKYTFKIFRDKAEKNTYAVTIINKAEEVFLEKAQNARIRRRYLGF